MGLSGPGANNRPDSENCWGWLHFLASPSVCPSTQPQVPFYHPAFSEHMEGQQEAPRSTGTLSMSPANGQEERKAWLGPWSHLFFI
jgi:hypothetical protein